MCRFTYVHSGLTFLSPTHPPTYASTHTHTACIRTTHYTFSPPLDQKPPVEALHPRTFTTENTKRERELERERDKSEAFGRSAEIESGEKFETKEESEGRRERGNEGRREGGLMGGEPHQRRGRAHLAALLEMNIPHIAKTKHDINRKKSRCSSTTCTTQQAGRAEGWS